MASIFEQQIDDMIGNCMQAFGEPVVYTEPGHLPQNIVGVFDRAYLELLPMGGSMGQEGMQFGASGGATERKPILGVQLSQFRPGHPPVQGALVELTSLGEKLRYAVKEVQPDGKGAAKLTLLKAPR